MKKLGPVWFLQSPIDSEHKNYILLDFLKTINEEIGKNKLYNPLKTIFSLIEDLERFSKTGEVNLRGRDLSPEEKKSLRLYSQKFFGEEEIREIENTLSSCLRILYKYADMGVDLWKELENRIKIYSLKAEETDKDRGITIFRNMSTNEVFPYWWKKTEVRMGDKIKKGIVLKKVSILNNYFSMSYEFILHETLVHMGIRDASRLPCTIIEISEDFDQSSEIFKIAKEKFLKEIEED